MQLAELHPSFTVIPDPPSRLSDPPIAQLLKAFPYCPADYVSLVTELDGFSVKFVDQNRQITIYIMGSHDVLEFPSDYPHIEMLGKSFFFATDGDLSYFYTVEEDHPPGVYRVETSTPSWREVEFIAPTIRHMLAEGVGIL